MARDVFDTFATHTGFGYDVTVWAHNGSSNFYGFVALGRLFSLFCFAFKQTEPEIEGDTAVCLFCFNSLPVDRSHNASWHRISFKSCGQIYTRLSEVSPQAFHPSL